MHGVVVPFRLLRWSDVPGGNDNGVRDWRWRMLVVRSLSLGLLFDRCVFLRLKSSLFQRTEVPRWRMRM
jgi:hypothetical protein